MKKLVKTFIITFLSIILCFNGTTLAHASTIDSTTPRLSHTNIANFLFTASSAGGEVVIQYTGNVESFARAEVNVKLQKRFLLLFWSDVDEWNTNSTKYSDILTHTFSLNGTGTYKAIFTVKIIGIDGTVDTYTNEIESKY